MKLFRVAAAFAFVMTSFAANAADYPAPKQAAWIAKDFKFHTGEVMPEMRLGYTTVGEPLASRWSCCMVRAVLPPAC